MSSHTLQDDVWPLAQFQYERHRPATTLLYRLVQQHWPASNGVSITGKADTQSLVNFRIKLDAGLATESSVS